MEEVLIEKTINLLANNLQEELVTSWNRQEGALNLINPGRKAELEVPIDIEKTDFFRFSLDERPSTKHYRFIISAQRTILDTTNRADFVSEYDLEIICLYDFRYDQASRYYIPMRIRNAIADLIRKEYRQITGSSSHITPTEMIAAEATNKGGRTVMTGIVYKIVF